MAKQSRFHMVGLRVLFIDIRQASCDCHEPKDFSMKKKKKKSQRT